MIKIKILSESRQLLNEVSYEDAKKTLDGSKYVKKLKNIAPEIGPIVGLDFSKDPDGFVKYVNSDLLNIIPEDIPDNSKGLALLWLKQKLIDDPRNFYTWKVSEQRNLIERFFQYNGSQQMPNFIRPVEKKDLNKVESLDELEQLIIKATPLYNKYQEERQNKDAESGTEKIYDGTEWTIVAAHNKGAACELGKGTKWCTAAPGLDYFKHYYKEDSPLFIFISKKDPSEKYQFSYSADQFMDKNDHSVYGQEIFDKLTKLLVNVPGIIKKYPILKSHVYYNLGGRRVQIKDFNGVKHYFVNRKKVMTKDEEGNIRHYDRDESSFHRENGPAAYNKYEYEKDPDNAPQLWYVDGLPHRVDGPAEINEKGIKFWSIKGKKMNLDPKYKYGGPMIVKPDGEELWYMNFGYFRSEKAFNEYIEQVLDNKNKEYDRIEINEVEQYLTNLKANREKYLNKKLKESKKYVVRILRNT